MGNRLERGRMRPSHREAEEATAATIEEREQQLRFELNAARGDRQAPPPAWAWDSSSTLSADIFK